MVTIMNNARNTNDIKGFTLVELMIVIAIIGVIVAIAYPNYQKSVIKTKRTDMMTTMQSLASELQAQKVGKGSYAAFSANDISNLIRPYAAQSTANLYDITINLDSNNDTTLGDWLITATPKTTPSNLSQMKDDGTLTLDANGIKCRGTKCGTHNEWNE